MARADQPHTPTGALTAEDADRHFRRFWEQLVPVTDDKRALKASVDALVTEPPIEASISRQAYRDYRALLEDRLAPAERSSRILQGELAALDRDGECWAVFYDGMLGPSVSACVDVATGRILLAWVTAEG